MPRILRIINRFNLGGPTYNVAFLTKYLDASFETLLVGGAKDESEESSEFIIEKLGIKSTIVPEMKRKIDLRDDFIAYKKIKQLIKDFKPDIVHTHASKAGTLGRLAAHHCNVPVILHTFHGHVFHSYFGKMKTTFYKNIERYLATKSTAIIAISEKQKLELSRIHNICPENKIKVVPLGFDLSKFQENMDVKRASFRSTYKVKEDEIAVGIIGRLVPVKNHELFLQAARHVADHTKKSVRFFIIGDGELMPVLKQKVKELNLQLFENKSNSNCSITFTSWIKEIDFACAGLDIIALTSFNEGTPVSLIEAQAANKPIVSTNVGGIENVVIPETALLSNFSGKEDFSSNLLKLIENDEMRESMSKAGWNHVKDKFHFTRLVADMEKLYAELLTGQNKVNAISRLF